MLTLCGQRLRIMTTCMLVTFILLGSEAYAESVVLDCKRTRLLVDGKKQSDRELPNTIYVFDEEKQTLRSNGEECVHVVITSKNISAGCGRSSDEIDRTNGQLHSRWDRRTGCVRGSYANGKYLCYEYGYERIDIYGECEKQQVGSGKF